MVKERGVLKIIAGKPVIEGDGVHLKRVFGFGEQPEFDPFLLLDDFRSTNPTDYERGFPWHPHRGIETISYVLRGTVEHGDSLGNHGVIGRGDVQWMTAGSGIIHQEMPKGDQEGVMGGFQLWANLPASHKMMKPRYRDLKGSDIPVITTDKGVQVRVICGEVEGTSGPLRDIVIDPEYLDVSLPRDSEFVHPTKPGHTVFAYLIEGRGVFAGRKNPFVVNGSLVLFDNGDRMTASTEEEPVRFLLVSGKPIGEPVVWSGPIVMNTREELETAFREFRDGTFIK